MSAREEHWDVIVIGSGLGGLSAGAQLAKSGKRVLVLEQHVFAGGYAHHFPRRVKGTRILYNFDVALHQTGDLKPGRGMYQKLSNLGVLDKLTLHEFDTAYRTIGPDHDFVAPANHKAYEDKLADCYPHESRGIRDLFETFRLIDTGSGTFSAEALASMDMSLGDLIAQHNISDPRVISIICTLWGYLGSVPSRVSAFLFVQMWASYHLGGCFYMAGGGQSLSDAFVDIITEHGGAVKLRSEVKTINTNSNGAVTGVETRKGKRYFATQIISNAAVPNTFNQLLDQPALAEAERTLDLSLPIAVSISQAYIGLKGDASDLGLADRGRFIETSYDHEEQWDHVLKGNYQAQSFILGNHNLADPGHQPAGRSIVIAAMLANGSLWMDLDDKVYRERKAELTEYFIDRLAEAIPDIRERIEICEVGTPHTMARYSSNPNGSIYGYASDVGSHSIHRPQPRSSVSGLYLAGAWTFPGPGFGGAMSSGFNTAKLVLEDSGT
jgi:phytoene dehydrogenase-like protein